ncbi:hypothetical protein C8J57DRAFT_1478783 [Mycena rebaudengoi]|nr:hypothetical protein C8J57DRAFT_1478783 [Mycena rebaudengoi]
MSTTPLPPLPSSVVLDADGCATCPDCMDLIPCGSAGLGNLQNRHRGSKKCKETQAKKGKKTKSLKDSKLLSFLRPKAVPVPSTVVAPALLQLPPPAVSPFTTRTGQPLHLDCPILNTEDSACGSMEISEKDVTVLLIVPSVIDIPQRAVSITVDSTSTAALPPSPDADAATSQEESPPTIETPELGRGKRKRKARDIGDLSQCLCGNSISSSDSNAVKCNRNGCETGWYCLPCTGLHFAVQNWTCLACASSASTSRLPRASKRARKDD